MDICCTIMDQKPEYLALYLQLNVFPKAISICDKTTQSEAIQTVHIKQLGQASNSEKKSIDLKLGIAPSKMTDQSACTRATSCWRKAEKSFLKCFHSANIPTSQVPGKCTQKQCTQHLMSEKTHTQIVIMQNMI